MGCFSSTFIGPSVLLLHNEEEINLTSERLDLFFVFYLNREFLEKERG